MSTQIDQTDAARTTRYRLDTVRAVRPRCPRCGGALLYKFRSVRDQGDGTSLAWMRCGNKQCGHRFRLVLE